jgi:tRNA dimethylallyltransferase
MKPAHFSQPCLAVIAGPTAIGKTALSIELAKHFNTEIISADSRQFFHELKIGAAPPSKEELGSVPHHLIGHLSVNQSFTVADFEKEALEILQDLFKVHDIVIVTGGSGLYINALCNGLDELPSADPLLREELNDIVSNSGLEVLVNELKEKDPEAAAGIDLHNPQRVIRAIEVIRLSGKKYSEQRSSLPKPRPFKIIRILLEMDREKLYERINKRVDKMIDEGLIAEAKELYPLRHLNALQTVGYKEVFEHFDGKISLDKAIELIKQNTRRYAKRQLTWFRNDPGYKVFHPSELKEITEYITTSCAT